MQFRKLIAASGAAIIGLAGLVAPSAPAAASTAYTAQNVTVQAQQDLAKVEQSEAAAAMPTPPRVKDVQKQVQAAKAVNSAKKGSTFPKGSAPTPRKPGITQAKAASTSKALLDPTVYYRYNSGYKYVEVDGFSANLPPYKNYLAPGDFHNVTEVAVQSADGMQKVEIGWVVSQNINGDLDPHLFGYHWVNDQETCWNTCGYVDVSTTALNLGDTIPSNLWGSNSLKFGIQHFDNVWWLGFNGEWIGYFPDTNWTSQGVTFTKGGLVQAFGESASAKPNTCSDMGNGALGTGSSAGNINSASFINPNPAQSSALNPPEIAPGDANPDKFTAVFWPSSVRSFYYGGPGFNSIGTGPGATGSCAPATPGTCAASTMCIWREICPDGGTTGCNLALGVTSTSTACTAMPSGITNAIKNNTAKLYSFYTNTSCTGTPFTVAANSQGKFAGAYANGGTLRYKRSA